MYSSYVSYRYSSPIIRSLTSLPVQRYTNDEGLLDLNTATNFSHLLSSIRQHLCSSTHTQGFYVDAAQRMFYELSSNNPFINLDSLPSHDDFVQFVVNHWPTFKPIGEEAGKFLWGRVSKSPDALHEVGISYNLIYMAEMVSPYFNRMC
jgi:hypothetical protein